ncbi:hypothetical protein BC938DRAFT_483251 [Jimgerdemannia flammicorona]|uniref:Uncharacterized protein n=1 Tax=Jimgerdemannia flammicorona TaxID=994334 RepID=A0A433QVT3_9FUNG|nr:hypothetical protein BC938DRAFT_483251 [Jimgerdemannia flammicorona]
MFTTTYPHEPRYSAALAAAAPSAPPSTASRKRIWSHSFGNGGSGITAVLEVEKAEPAQKRHTSVDREFNVRHPSPPAQSPLSVASVMHVVPVTPPASSPMQRGDSGVGSMMQGRFEDETDAALERRMSDVSMDDVTMGDAVEHPLFRTPSSYITRQPATPPRSQTTVQAASQQQQLPSTSISMGWRADCEKCRLKVPGHYVHIIRGEK